jgi:hypothetical protein
MTYVGPPGEVVMKIGNEPLFRCFDCNTQFPPKEAIEWLANTRGRARPAGSSSSSPFGRVAAFVLLAIALAGLAYIAERILVH